LKNKAIFVGQGRKFQVWNPDDFEEFKEKAKVKALEHRNLIGPVGLNKVKFEEID
jgi:DNA-binding transcriptional regulator/RsmH inhibitor MraZ